LTNRWESSRFKQSEICSNIARQEVCPFTDNFRRVMVIPTGKLPGLSVWRKALFSAMHLNANFPGAYFGVPPAQVVKVGLEVEI
jgi:K+ transporter